MQQFQARYCSQKCHEEDWEQHKDFCRRRRKERKQRRKEKSKKEKSKKKKNGKTEEPAERKGKSQKKRNGNRNEPNEDGLEVEDEGEKKEKQYQ